MHPRSTDRRRLRLGRAGAARIQAIPGVAAILGGIFPASGPRRENEPFQTKAMLITTSRVGAPGGFSGTRALVRSGITHPT